MTSYIISLGYNSGDSSRIVQSLLGIINNIREDPKQLVHEVIKLHYDDDMKLDKYFEFAEMYRHRNKDLTLVIHGNHDYEELRITQLASGGGTDRQIKEDLRRAFCRLVLVRMHKLRLEINISVS